jgi:hypothetical protein
MFAFDSDSKKASHGKKPPEPEAAPKRHRHHALAESSIAQPGFTTEALHSHEVAHAQQQPHGTGGMPLEAPARAQMESRFGHRFGHVRIHDDLSSGLEADRAGARAFTENANIHFGEGFDARRPDDQALLTHELAHVVQGDRAALDPAAPASPRASLEREARDAVGAQTPAIFGRAASSEVLHEDEEEDDLGTPTFGNIYGDSPDPARRYKLEYDPARGKWYEIIPGRERTKRRASGWYDFVIQDGVIWGVKGRGPVGRDLPGHTEAARGGRVSFAGQIKFTSRSGQVTYWDNASGHYVPTATAAPSIARATRLPEGLFERAKRPSMGPVQLPVFQPRTNLRATTVPILPKTGFSGSGGGGARGGGMRGAAVAAGASFFESLALMAINSWMGDYFEDWRANAFREFHADALKDANPKIKAVVEANLEEIQAAQDAGRFVSVRVVTQIGTVDHKDESGVGVGVVPHNSKVVDIKIIYEGENVPAYDPDHSLAGDLIRALFGFDLKYETDRFELEGTDTDVRSRLEMIKNVETEMGPRSTEFEEMILRSLAGGSLSLDTLREYSQYRSELAHVEPWTDSMYKRNGVEYWGGMLELFDAPISDVIIRAKIKDLSLAGLRAYAEQQREDAGQSGDAGAGAQRHAYWSDIIEQIDAPLDERYAVDRWRYMWSKGAPPEVLAEQRDVVIALEAQITSAEERLTQLQDVDARTPAERAAGEPAHPPWAEIQALREKLKRAREDLGVERRLLKDYQGK